MNKTAKIILGAVVLIVVVLITVFYEPTPRETIKIGVIIALTGNYQDVGQRIKEGIDIALTDIKENNIEVVYEDSKADTQTAIAAYRKLVDIDGTKVIIVAHSNISLALAPLAQKEKIILFALYAVAPGIPETGDYIFRNDISVGDEMKKMSEFVFQHGYKNIALFYVNTEGSMTSISEFKKYFTALGGEIVGEEKYEKNEVDYRTYLTKIKSTNPDAIFSVSAPKQMGMIINQARILKINQPFFGDWHVEGVELMRTAGEYANGLIYSHTLNQYSKRQEVKNFVNRYQEKYHQEADYRSALAYDTLMMIVKSIDNCVVREISCFKDKLSGIKNETTVTGMTTMNQYGDTSKEIIIKAIKNGQFVPYEE